MLGMRIADAMVLVPTLHPAALCGAAMNISELEVGMRVVFIGGQRSHPVSFVGPKFFHIALDDGRISGPYPPELVAKVE
jgi:hypothetical protein